MRTCLLSAVGFALVLTACERPGPPGQDGPQGPEGPSGPPSFRTKWSATAPGTYESEVGSFWTPVSRKVTIFKTSDTTRLKINVSDNLRVGYRTGSGTGGYQVRMNGSNAGCDALQDQTNVSNFENNYLLPFANFCVTDVLPKGLYEFEVWANSSPGTGYVGWGTNGRAILLVEEFDDAAQYGLSEAGGIFSTFSVTYVKATPGREVTYNKQSSSSVLKVILADTLRVGLNQNGGSGSVMIRMDGVDTTCNTGKLDRQGVNGEFNNPFVMTCILPGATGSHTFSVWLRSEPGGVVRLGWGRTNPTLLVQELPADGMTYSNLSLTSELSGSWQGVVGRQIIHNVSAAGKTMKVTYSDTFRAVLDCNDRAGYFQLYVDNQPTGCMNGQHVFNGSGVGQDHQHPMNQICLVPDLAPSSHTFAIWSTSSGSDGMTCGSNSFGWNRGQNLLMVEELP
jgi:hypothetical protein